MAIDSDAVVCDLAEYYGVYDYKGLPLMTAATLVFGLREESRIKQLIAKVPINTQQMILASILDRVSLLLWAQTEDGRHNRNKPQSVVSVLMGDSSESNTASFANGEDFEAARTELLRHLGG